ncbi:MAG: hypothetical protein ABIO60_08080 [Aquaticitalea sp.]
MKKLMVFAAVAVFGLSNVNAQNFNVGISAGLPIGNAGDFSSFSAILDANYLWNVSEQFDAGIASGFSNSFGKNIKIDGETFDYGDFSFVPIAGAARYNVSDKFTLGADLGYAIGVNNGNDGGFYYAPKVQYGVSENLDLVLAYRGVSSNGGSFDILSFGIEFGL